MWLCQRLAKPWQGLQCFGHSHWQQQCYNTGIIHHLLVAVATCLASRLLLWQQPQKKPIKCGLPVFPQGLMNGRSSVAALRQQQQQQQERSLQSQEQQLQRHAQANALPPAMRSTVAVADHTDDEASSVASFGGVPQPLLQNLREIDAPTGRLQNGAVAGVSAAASSAAADALSDDSTGGSQSVILAPAVADIAAEVRAGTRTMQGNIILC